MTTLNRSKTFGRLLKAGIASIANCEGKTAPVVEDELGQQIGIAGKTIQRYKAGALPPEARTVAILATAAIQRGFLGREWLQRFLHAARYHQADRLLDQLCPLGPAHPRPPRVYENLPAPTYSQFVMRPQAFAEVADGLGKRTAAVLIVGLGGNGKTSLAREVAAACLKDDAQAPRFDSVVWVSDKDRPGTTNLSTVLDEIARTLDYPGFTQFAHDEKRREVEQLLRRQRVLLVIDNFETITDGALLTWLLNMPEPSKALITTREYWREFRRGGWPVELRGMSEAEAWELMSEHARALKIDRLLNERAELEPLLAATGGNPKALTMTMGLIKYERRPLQQVVDDLYAARGEIFDKLFTRAWSLLDEAARRVLLVTTFFPTSASSEALSASADVQGFAFDRAVERLANLSLLDVQQEDLNSPPRYVLHPLVRAFARAKLAEQPGFEPEARKRWLNWYANLTSSVGHSWDNLDKLNILENDEEVILSSVEWAFVNKHHQDVVSISDHITYYYYVRGLWNQRLRVESLRADAAHIIGDITQEIIALSNFVMISSRQGKMNETDAIIERLLTLKDLDALPTSAYFRYYHALAFHQYSNGNVSSALSIWQGLNTPNSQLSIHDQAIVLRWIGECLLSQDQILEASNILQNTLDLTITNNLRRSFLFVKIRLAKIDLLQNRIEESYQKLQECFFISHQYKDRWYTAQIQYLLFCIFLEKADLPAARAALSEAIDLFERLGMRRELADARADLARLETPGAPVGGAPGA